MCVKFNPCFCCPAEVGVYILSMTHAVRLDKNLSLECLYIVVKVFNSHLTMTWQLSITAAFVMGLVLGFETFSLVLEPNLSICNNLLYFFLIMSLLNSIRSHYLFLFIVEKSLRLGIFILYVLFFIAEVVMREYLYKTLELVRFSMNPFHKRLKDQ